MNPIDTQPDALRLANTLERCLQDLPDEVGLRLHRDFLTEVASELRRLHAELDRLRQAQGGEAVAMPDKVATAVLDTPEPDKWVDCGEARPLPMFHMATLMQYGERCAEAALSTFTPDVKTRDFFVPTKVTDEMVSRFLSWKLPKNFYPDSFISFDREKHDAWGGYQNSWPTGTNLLHAGQAKEMLQHVLGNTSPPLQADAKVPLSKTDAEYWLNSRSQIIDAVEKAGFKLMSNKDGFWLSASPAAPTQVETQEVRQREIQKLQAWRDEIASGNAYRVVAEIEAILRAAARSTPPMGQK